MMKFLSRYFRYYGIYIVLYGACIGIFIAVCLLYQLPFAAIGYPAALCVLLGISALLLHVYRTYKRHQSMAALKGLSGALYAELPEA
ncbi:MAG: hypothetical protein ACI3XM_07110 [Eubacteriales bacterium]